MQEGWIDYLAPQVYWSMDFPAASHRKIVDWWVKNNNNTNLYIGNGAYKVRNNSDVAWERKKELPEQMTLARKTSKIQGNILFSARSLMNDNPDVVSYLKRKYYKLPALPPTVTNNTGERSKEVQLVSKNGTDNSLRLTFNGIDDKPYALFYTSTKRVKSEYPMKKLLQKLNIKGNSGQIKLPSAITSNRYLAITFLDKYGKESSPIVIQPKKINQK
jgi:hypothetical protein